MNISSTLGSFVDDLRAALPTDNNQSPTHGQFVNQSVVPITQNSLIPTRKNAPLFKFLQQRSINGCKWGHGIDCLHFFADLARRQLLSPGELEVLARAVATGECIIEPALCRSSQGIDALRVLAAFLIFLDKFPKLKQELDDFITRDPTTDDILSLLMMSDGYQINDLRQLQSELKAVLKKYNAFIDRKHKNLESDAYGVSVTMNPDRNKPNAETGEGINRHLSSRYDEIIRSHFKHLLERNVKDVYQFTCSFPLKDGLKAKKHHMELRDRLIQLIDRIGHGLCCADKLNGRIDHLSIHKALVFNSRFSDYIISRGYMRRQHQNDTYWIFRQLSDLSNRRFLHNKVYIDTTMCINVDREIAYSTDFSPLNIAKKRPRHLWVNYHGIFLQFELDNDPMFAQSFQSMTCPDNPEQYATSEVRRFFEHSMELRGVASYAWIIDLYVALHKWLNEPEVEANQASAITFLDKMWDCEYSMLDDFQWLISVIARSGLRPYAGQDYSAGVLLLCPNYSKCNFFAKVSRSYNFCDAISIRQLQGRFMNLLQDHKRHQKCTVAQAIQPEELWCERNHNSQTNSGK